MPSKNRPYTNSVSATLKIGFWLFSGILLYLIVQNAESAESSSEITDHIVTISGFKFVPKQLKVKVGETITWVNKDIVPHNIINSRNQNTISPILATGEKFTFVAKKQMLYHCGLHPSMKGKLSITLLP